MNASFVAAAAALDDALLWCSVVLFVSVVIGMGVQIFRDKG